MFPQSLSELMSDGLIFCRAVPVGSQRQGVANTPCSCGSRSGIYNSKEKAARFFDSLINNPKIKDAELLSIPVCDADAYNESVQEEYITTIKGF